MCNFTKLGLLGVAVTYSTIAYVEGQTDVVKVMVDFGHANTTKDEGSILVL